jgi:hypothetical protein
LIDKGFRLATHAIWCIKAAIHEYILRSSTGSKSRSGWSVTCSPPKCREAGGSIKYQVTIAKLPLATEIKEFDFAGTPVNESLVRDRDLGGNGWQAKPGLFCGCRNGTPGSACKRDRLGLKLRQKGGQGSRRQDRSN